MRTNPRTLRSFLKVAGKNNEHSLYWKAVVRRLRDHLRDNPL